MITLQRLALLNGFLFGLALALGAFLPEIQAFSQVPVQLVYPVALAGGVAVIAIATLAGWAGGRLEFPGASLLAWAIATALIVLLLGHLPYEGRTLAAWLDDARFWGRAIYAFDDQAQVRMLVAAFFLSLGLLIPGLIQDYRLEGVRSAFSRGRPTLRALLLLLLPLPLVAAVGYAADSNVSRPLRGPPLLVHAALTTARTYTGDLFALGRETGENYGAVAGVRELMGQAAYTLTVGDSDLGAAQTVWVVAHFDNGAWINCRVLAGQLSHCADASLPYTQGLAGALSGLGTPGCQACTVRLDPGTQAWLRDQGQRFTGPPAITRLAQYGGHVLMRAADPAGTAVVECFFTGMGVVTIDRCYIP
jgi:hypothetical protein